MGTSHAQAMPRASMVKALSSPVSLRAFPIRTEVQPPAADTFESYAYPGPDR